MPRTWTDEDIAASIYDTFETTDRKPWQTPISSVNTRIVRDLLPMLQKAIGSGYKEEALGQLEAGRAASPGFAELMTQLYGQYGPQLNQIGSDISAQNARNELSTNQELLSGGGMDLLRQLDPEYFATRAQTSSRLGDLLSSIDLGSGISGVEQREIEQGLAREGTSRGTYGAPSQSDVVGNAMRYGEAGRKRELENRNSLSSAIAASTAFLPASRAGSDSFALGTGKTAGVNPGGALFTGIAKPNADLVSGTANNMYGQAGETWSTQQQIGANKKDFYDKFAQVAEGAGSFIGGILGGVACWVAREVYGETNPLWLQFRHWLLTRADASFRNAYLHYGPDFAKRIRNKPAMKERIRKFMDSKIAELPKGEVA